MAVSIRMRTPLIIIQTSIELFLERFETRSTVNTIETKIYIQYQIVVLNTENKE